MTAASQPQPPAPRDGMIPVPNAALYCREAGQGQPIIVLHGGPDFDHTYLLPDLDRLAGAYRLIYYDQRGRGRSTGDEHAVSLESEVEDLDVLRQHLGLDRAALLGHSWGGVLALEYALRHPERVSHLILLNTAPASREGILLVRDEIAGRLGPRQARLNELRTSPGYAAGDPEAVAAFYQVRFAVSMKRPEYLARLDLGFGHFTQADVLRARAIETQLYDDTYHLEGYDLTPRLKHLRIPTLLIHGDYDWIPVACAARIAEAIPGARLVVLPECGHFAFIEAPEAVRQALDDFFRE